MDSRDADTATIGKTAGWKSWLPILLIVAVGFAFAPALRSAFVLWDDDLNITDNTAFRGFTGTHLRWMFSTLHGGHYQPLNWLTFALDHALWGLDATGYHLTNVLLHAVNTVLVYLLVQALLARAWMHRPLPDFRVAAAVGTLFFGLHPLRVESVAWVTERRDVLSACFYLLALLTYLQMQDPAAGKSRRRTWYAVSVGCFALSVLAKAWGITFPFVLLALDVYPLRRIGGLHAEAVEAWRRVSQQSVAAVLLEKLPFAALAVGAAALAWLAQSQTEGIRSLAQHGVAARVAQAAYGLSFYLWKTLAPVHLSPLYLLEPILNPLEPRYVFAAIVVVSLTAGLVAFRHRWPWALAAWSVYVLIVSPVLGLTQVGPQLVADRYTYLACLPAAALVAAAVQRWAVQRAVVLAAACAALALLGAQTLRQCGIWRNSLALWESAVRLDPGNYYAFTNRGLAQERLRDNLDAAIADYTTAIQLNPNHATALFNRGHARELRGDLAGAIADYSAALHADPRHVMACYNRGLVRQQQGDLAGAADDFAHALELTPPGWDGRDRIVRSLSGVRAGL